MIRFRDKKFLLALNNAVSSLFTDILYQIRRISLEDDSFMYCLWIAKDPEEGATGRLGTLTLATTQGGDTIDESLGEVFLL